MKEYDKNWLYTRSQLPTRKLEEAESRTELLLQMANNILDMSVRISQLESRLILNANVTKQLEDRIHQLEKCQTEGDNETGNSSFEEYEMHHPDPSYVENDPFAEAYHKERELDAIIAESNLDETGTHAPNCCCAWCESQETLENMNETL